jgi:hypothetical protein
MQPKTSGSGESAATQRERARNVKLGISETDTMAEMIADVRAIRTDNKQQFGGLGLCRRWSVQFSQSALLQRKAAVPLRTGVLMRLKVNGRTYDVDVENAAPPWSRKYLAQSSHD